MGGVSCNRELQYMIKMLAHEYNHQMNVCPTRLCTDNAAMIGWMGWELKNALQDVDIRTLRVDGHKTIPLGSYIRDHMIFKGSSSKSSEIERVRKQIIGMKGLE